MTGHQNKVTLLVLISNQPAVAVCLLFSSAFLSSSERIIIKKKEKKKKQIYSTNHITINRRALTVCSSAAAVGKREIFSEGYATALAGPLSELFLLQLPAAPCRPRWLPDSSAHSRTAARLVLPDFTDPFVKHALTGEIRSMHLSHVTHGVHAINLAGFLNLNRK